MEGDIPSAKQRGAEAIFKTFEPSTRKFNDSKAAAGDTATHFEFVDPRPPKSSNRRAARSHVMRRYHTEKRNQLTGEPIKAIRNPTPPGQASVLEWRAPTSPSQGSGTTLTGPPHCGKPLASPSISNRLSRTTKKASQCLCCSTKGKQYCPASNCTFTRPQPDSGLEPVFQGMFSVSNRSLQLLRFSIHEVARFSIPIGNQAEASWFTQATSNPAFFHGTLLLGATYRALTLGRTPSLPPECYFHQVEAIRHIVANLESAEAQIQEANVAAVACLAAFETTVNHVANEPVHIDGLERMLTVRRAKHEELAGYLQKLIQWVDVSHASANLRPPRFLSMQAKIPTPPTQTLDEEISLLNALNSQWPGVFPSSPIRVYEGMDDITACMFHRVRQLSSLASRIHACRPVSEETEYLRQQYTQGMLLLEGQVNTSIWSLARNNVRQHGSSTQARAEDSVRACTRTWHGTCLLYIHLFLRRALIGPKSIIISKIVTRVKYSLRILNDTELWVSFPKPFLLCAMGFVRSGGCREWSWAISGLWRNFGRQNMVTADPGEAERGHGSGKLGGSKIDSDSIRLGRTSM
ncbi:hypothetical protein ONS96_005362 [Cadophora gregata f. sp. sojae]|nr:hypothetical protein ONS96_005362 [Cadophora gregata f. sp. sojae]